MRIYKKTYVCWNCKKVVETQAAHQGDAARCPHCGVWN